LTSAKTLKWLNSDAVSVSIGYWFYIASKMVYRQTKVVKTANAF